MQEGLELRLDLDSCRSRHQQLKDRLDEELALEAKAEENLKAKARLFGNTFFLCLLCRFGCLMLM